MDIHAIEDGRKLCIPTGIVKFLSFSVKFIVELLLSRSARCERVAI